MLTPLTPCFFHLTCIESIKPTIMPLSHMHGMRIEWDLLDERVRLVKVTFATHLT